MVRAALSQPKRFGQGPSRYALFVPAATVVAASLLAALPIVSTSGWFPDFG
jgi:rod shape-determining protein MreD